MKNNYLTYILIITCLQFGTAQMGEYFQTRDSIEVNSMELNIIKKVQDSIVLNLFCHANYSNYNRLDSIICKDIDNNIVTKYEQQNMNSGTIIKTTYFNQQNSYELYRIEKFIPGKESSIQYTNNKNNKGYKLTTIYDECGIESEKQWHTNDTITIKQIHENIYNENFNCEDYRSKTKTRIFNQFNYIVLNNSMTASDFDNCQVGRYHEEFMGIQYISLNGDTIIITETDSIKYVSQTKTFSNDTLNFSEMNSRTLNGFGGNRHLKLYETKKSLRREDKWSFEGIGSDEGIKYNLSITNQNGTFDYSGEENTPFAKLEKRISKRKTYQFDFYKNWIKGTFEINKNEEIIVDRKIKYD